MGRLLSVTRDGSLVEEYAYDLSGTRITETNTLRDISGRSMSYSDEDHLLSAGDAIYSYDLHGFLSTKTLSGQVTTYNYSTRGELQQVVLPDGRTVSYDHDPLGRRITKRIDGAVVAKYLWEGMTKLLAVYDGSDNLLQRYEYADSRMPVAITQSGIRNFLAYDQVGSLRVVTDASGNMVKKIDYDSFGNIIADSNPSLSLPFGFSGGLLDLDTGLVRFGFRDYDPDTGRWTAKDPIGFSGGDTDLYGYVQNDPVNLVDPFGLLVQGTVNFGGLIGAGFGSLKAIFMGASLNFTFNSNGEVSLQYQGLLAPDG
jgi:RHS repeat-associated protein